MDAPKANMHLTADQKAILTHHIKSLLSDREYPKTICPSEVARALSAPELEQLGIGLWRDAMPAVRTVVFDMRCTGEVEVLQKGEVLGEEVGVGDVVGPIRVRRKQ